MEDGAISSEPATGADTRRDAGLTTAMLCFLIACFEGVDLQAAGLVSTKLAPLFHLSPGQMGWFFSVGNIGLVAGALVGGRVADRFGRKPVLLAAMGIFGLASVATAWSSGFEGLAWARFVTGLGLGAALPNLVALTAENAPENRRNLAVSLMYSGMPFGGGLASLLMGLGVGGDDWRGIFYVGGLAPLLALPIVVFWLRDSRTADRPVEGQRTGIAFALLGEGRAIMTLALWVNFFCALVILYLLLNWLPSLLISRGLSHHEASFVQAAFNLVGVCGSLLVGWSMDGRYRRWVIAVVFVALGACLALFSVAPVTIAISLATGSLLGAATLGAQSVLYNLAPGIYAASVRGTGLGAAVGAGRLGSIAGPLLAGALVGQGRSVAYILSALLPLVAVSGAISLTLDHLARRDAKS